MRRNGVPYILMLLAIAVTPLALLPLVGASVVLDLSKIDARQDARALSKGDPVRLISAPMVPVPGHPRDFLIITIDVPSEAAADRVCAMIPRLHDAIHVFAQTEFAEPGRAWRLPGDDPALARHLSDVLSGVPIDGARLIRQETAHRIHPRRDLHECRAEVARPIAEPGAVRY